MGDPQRHGPSTEFLWARLGVLQPPTYRLPLATAHARNDGGGCSGRVADTEHCCPATQSPSCAPIRPDHGVRHHRTAHRRGPGPSFQPSRRTQPPPGHRRHVRRPGGGDGDGTAHPGRSQPCPALRALLHPRRGRRPVPGTDPFGAWNPGTPNGPDLELVVNRRPCAMCRGAAMGSGIRCMVITGEGAEPEQLTGLDEGPMPEDWAEQFEQRGIQIVSGAPRDEAVAVFRAYGEREDAVVHNARRRDRRLVADPGRKHPAQRADRTGTDSGPIQRRRAARRGASGGRPGRKGYLVRWRCLLTWGSILSTLNPSAAGM